MLHGIYARMYGKLVKFRLREAFDKEYIIHIINIYLTE